MPIDNEQISQLIVKYLNDTLSVEEKNILESWVGESAGNRELFEKISSEEKLAKGLKEMMGFDEEKGWNLIKSKMEEKPDSRIQYLRWIRNLSVAAVVTAIIAGSYFYFFPGNNATAPALAQSEKHQVIDKDPGKEGAMLILANGEKLLLDSLGNGPLTTQAGARLLKKNGSLVWEGAADQVDAEEIYNQIVTPRGRQFNVTLSDGTRVWLNSASSIRFPVVFTGNERKVEITGEVYFEVARKLSSTFKVKAGEVEIKVLGTHFNINAFPEEDQISTTLIEGKVQVNVKDASLGLIPGQQANLTRKDQQLKIASEVDINKVMAWRSGFFEFDNTELKSIMRQISRWYDVDVVYESAPSDEKYGGGISKQLPLKQVLGMLETNGVTFRLEENTLYVKP